MADRLLSVDISRRFPDGPTIGAALALDLGGGETLGLFGPSGSGKTTVLRCLAGLERPDRGVITAAGVAWFDAARGISLSPQRRRVGYLPQGYALFPHLSVRDNIAYGIGGGDTQAAVAEICEMLALTGLERRRPGELSGGQQQRVALGRALARRPALLLLDEPLSALDAPTRDELRLELRRLLRRMGVPAILVTHDRAEALALTDRLAVMVDGSIRQAGPTADLFACPTDADVARLVGGDVIGRGRVVDEQDGLVAIQVGEHRFEASVLEASAPSPVGSAVMVMIRPEEVVLTQPRADSPATSARNAIRGRVLDVEPLGGQARVTLDCGFPIRALVTARSADELGIRPGAELVAVVKATSVHLMSVVE